MLADTVITAHRAIEACCERTRVRSLAWFGSVLRDDFRADSDLDVLVTIR